MKRSTYKHIELSFFLLFGLGLISSCKKFIDVGAPKNLIEASSVYQSDATATAVVKGIYSDMINGGGFASGTQASITFTTGLSADELIAYSLGYMPYYNNALSPTNGVSTLWSTPYKYINNANSMIENLTVSSGVSDKTKNQLIGEAKFIRAFCFFYLVNLYGDVPLVISSDYRKNATLARTSKSEVYQQIIADLTDAQGLLATDFSFSNGERDQPNKWAATALLARVYLYLGEWTKAEEQATAIINNSTYSLISDLNTVFLKNSAETIWQLKPAGTAINTSEGNIFILTTNPSNASLSPLLYNSFETGDSRKTKWIGSYTSGINVYYYPFKYKIRTGTPLNEYSMVLRLAEQYLIRAEARTQQENIGGAQSDLNKIRNRAGLGNTTASNKTALLVAIMHERQTELFTEWGHRWFDLNRTGAIDAVMSVAASQKGSPWNNFQKLYPIPQTEISNDQNIGQNDGY
jgi:hypothetical protein